MMMTRALLENAGMTPEQSKDFKIFANFTSITDLFGEEAVLYKVGEYMYEEMASNVKLSKNVDIMNSLDINDEFTIDDLNMSDDERAEFGIAYNNVMEKITNEFLGRTEKTKFRFVGINHTNKCRRPHLPSYLDINQGTYTAGKSGIIELIDMTIEVNIVITRKVKATKNTKGLIEGYYSVDIKEA